MMNSMYNNGWGFGLSVLWGLHFLSVLAFFVGVFFLLYWAVKHLTSAQLKQWGWMLIIGGSVVCLFTIGVMGHAWNSMGEGFRNGSMMGNDRGTAAGGMGISMNGMSMMLRGKTGDDFDRTFLQMMIPHHQGAIDMATLAQQNAKHDEIKRMATDIISAQQREIDQMRQWQGAWGYTR